MRRVSLLLAALLLVAGVAFAQVSIEPEIEVEASATFGVQLDEMATGISNSAESTLSFTFTEEQTEEFGEGEVYGWIELEEFEIEFEAEGDDSEDEGAFDVSVGSVTGKVFIGSFWINLDEAEVEANEAEAFSLIDVRLIDFLDVSGSTDGTADVAADVGTTYAPEFPGVALGFMIPDLVEVEFGVASEFDWDSDADGSATGANDDNAYILSIDAEITPVEAVTVALVTTMEIADGNDPGTAGYPAGVGLSVEYALPMGDMTIAPVVGVDFYSEEDSVEDAESRLEIGIGAKIDWLTLGLDEDEDDHIDFIGNADEEEEVTSGAYFGAVYGIHSADLVLGGDTDESLNTLGIRLGLYEDSGDEGLLPVIGAALMVEYTQLFDNEDAGVAESRSDLGIGLQVDADLGVVSPYAGFLYIANDLGGEYLDADGDGETDTDTFAMMNVGVDINIISNTTFTIDYASGDLLYDKDENGGADPTYGNTWGPFTGSSAQAGVFSIETTVEF